MVNISIDERTALELLLPQTHFAVRGSILQHIPQMGTITDCETQHCAGATFASDTFRGPR